MVEYLKNNYVLYALPVDYMSHGIFLLDPAIKSQDD